MKKFDECAIELYLQDNPLNDNPKKFFDNMILFWIFSILAMIAFPIPWMLASVCLPLNIFLTIYFVSLKKKADDILSHYLCSGISGLYLSFICCAIAYCFYANVNEHRIAVMLGFFLLYILFVAINTAFQLRKVRSIKAPKKAGKQAVTAVTVLCSVVGMFIARGLSSVMEYAEVMSLASIFSLLLSFLFSLLIVHVIKAYFIHSLRS